MLTSSKLGEKLLKLKLSLSVVEKKHSSFKTQLFVNNFVNSC